MRSVSLIIPTYGRPAALADTLRAIAPELETLGGECIVVDQSEAADAAAVKAECSRHIRATYVHVERPSLPGARNVGIRAARGDVLVFVDDDIVPSPGLLRAHLAAYARPEVGAVAGRVIEVRQGRNVNTRRLGTTLTWYGRVLRNFDQDRPGFVEAPPGGNMSFLRDVVRRTGDFDVKYEGNATLEETDYGFRVRRAGYLIAYAPDALVHHLAVPSGGCRLASERDVEISNLRNTLRFLRKYGRWILRPLQLAFLVATFLRRSRRVGIPLPEAVALAMRILGQTSNVPEGSSHVSPA